MLSSHDHPGLLKHGRCDQEGPDEHCSTGGFLKMARTEAMQGSAESLARRAASPPCFFLGSSSSGGQMLSFSSSDGACHHYPSYLRNNAGLDSGSSDASMQGVLARVRGPFTPTQWMELEHQALIYKHIVANAPVPASLLIPIRRSLHPSGFPSFSSGSFSSSSLGWGSFHLGYSGSADPEPGRCRRTDGKKWRCSRDAVADQKYCERHINRGRHRSRKHVEGRSSHAAKAMPAIAQSASAVSGGRSSGSRAMAQLSAKSLATNVNDPCPTQLDRMLLNEGNVNDHVQDSTSLSMPNSMNQKFLEDMFHNSKASSLFEETSSRADYALVSTGSLMNSPRSFFSENLSLIAQSRLNQQSQPNPVHHFFDEEMQPDRTQLSISIPMASSDFSSSSSSPNREKLTLSPLKLSHYYDQAHMGLGVGSSSNNGNKAQTSWVSVPWETSIGGPLGEVFTNTSNTPTDQSKNCLSASLNLLTGGWATSPQLHSPTGVLQTTNFSSVSSSTVSSPRLENHIGHNSHGSLCNGLLTASLVNPQTVPTL